MESVFPIISLVGFVCSGVSIYVFEVRMNLGVDSFIYGTFIHFSVQVVMKVIVLYYKSPEGCYCFPGWTDLLKNNRDVFWFIFNFSVAYLFELISYEMVPLVLIATDDPSLNIGVWSIITQNINLIFFIGYSASAYSRFLGNKILAQKSFAEFQLLMKKVFAYHLGFLVCLSVVFFVFAREISGLFFQDSETVDVLTLCFRIFSCFFVTEGFMMLLNSSLRMIGFEAFSFYVTLVVFLLVFPVSLVIVTVVLRTGVVMAISLICVSNTMVSALFLGRFVFGFRESVAGKIRELEDENMIHLMEK
ncbi:MAG: hypothetical protein AAFO91_09790 [Bacteroidota bacterium]